MVKYRIQQEEKAETQRHEQELLELWQNTIDAEEEADHLEVKLNLAHKIIDIHEKMKIMVGHSYTYTCMHTYIFMHILIHVLLHMLMHILIHRYSYKCSYICSYIQDIALTQAISSLQQALTDLEPLFFKARHQSTSISLSNTSTVNNDETLCSLRDMAQTVSSLRDIMIKISSQPLLSIEKTQMVRQLYTCSYILSCIYS